MQKKLRAFSANEHKNLILLIVALLAPEIVGFQHLEWWMGNTHSTFMMASITWTLTYSDWFSGVEGALNGWLLLPSPLTYALPNNLLLVFISPAIRLVFVAAVALYRQGRISKSILTTIGILLLGVSIADCASSMTVNVIYGIPPGLYISIVSPDVDTRLFLPVPILLIAGLLLSKKPNVPDVGV